MLMRSNAQFTSGQIKARDVDPSNRLTVRERIIETAEWSVCIPAIETISVSDRTRTGLRGTLWTLAVFAAAAGAANFALALVTPPATLLAAALASAFLLAVWAFSIKRSYELSVTSNEGTTFAVASGNRAKLDEIHAFVGEKINRQDINARRMFYLDGRDEDELGSHALGVDEALKAIAEHGEVSTAASRGSGPTAPAAPLTPDSADYSSVLAQITDLHRFYERRGGADHILERLTELELLMRAGSSAPHHLIRVRELALDLANLLSAYPPLAQLFGHVTRLTGR